MHRGPVYLLAAAVIAATVAGCGRGSTSEPRAATTPPVQYVVRSLDDAILRASYVLSGHTDPNGIEAAHVTSLSYVRTTAGAAAQLLGQTTPDVDANTTAWLFLEQGDFLQARPIGEAAAPSGHTLWVLAIESAGISYGIGPDSLDLASLGKPAVISPGQIPPVDERRVPVPSSGGGAVTNG